MGAHCAPLMHKHLKTEEQGIVRLSVSFQNTVEGCGFCGTCNSGDFK